MTLIKAKSEVLFHFCSRWSPLNAADIRFDFLIISEHEAWVRPWIEMLLGSCPGGSQQTAWSGPKFPSEAPYWLWGTEMFYKMRNCSASVEKVSLISCLEPTVGFMGKQRAFLRSFLGWSWVTGCVTVCRHVEPLPSHPPFSPSLPLSLLSLLSL